MSKASQEPTLFVELSACVLFYTAIVAIVSIIFWSILRVAVALS